MICISQIWDGTGDCNPSLWKKRFYLYHMFNMMVVADLTMARSHGISIHGIDTFFMVYFRFSNRRVNTLRPRQNSRNVPDDIFKLIFLNANVLISIKISLKFIPKGPIHNVPALVQIMAWCRPGNKPLSKPTMIILLTHICVTQAQWVKRMHESWLETL